MATELTMPQMGYDMQEGTILKWLKGEGDSVENGEPIAEIETDKAVVEFESYAAGVVRQILVAAGNTVPVGEPIAIVGEAAEAAAPAPEPPAADAPAADADEAPDEPPSAAIPMPPASDDAPAVEETPEPPLAAPAAPLRASPVARRIADERGINIAEVQGTGPGGRITRDDVIAYAAAPPTPEPEPAEEELEPVDAEADLAPAIEETPEPEPAVAEAEPFAAEEAPEPEPVVDESEPAETEAEAPEPAMAEAEPEVEETPEPEPVLAEAEPFETEAEAIEPEPIAAEAEPAAADAEIEEAPEPETLVAEVDPFEAQPEPAAAEAPASPADALALSRMRQQIARVTLRSKQEKPHFYVTSEVDMTEAMNLRRQVNAALETQGVRVTVNDLIIKACVDALKTHPKFNAFLENDAIRLNDTVNIGIAMAVEDGLLMPAIMGCEDMSLKDIAAASKDLADRAQNGALRPDEYTGGTFGISNLGMFDVSTFVAIIQPPQSAILAVGTVAKKPVVRDDQIVVRQIMNATISADHRIVDGAEGAQFLIQVKRLLENPLALIL